MWETKCYNAVLVLSMRVFPVGSWIRESVNRGSKWENGICSSKEEQAVRNGEFGKW